MGEETRLVPKPMVAVGGRPILWHVMRVLAGHGCQHFVLALGWLGHVVKQWVLNLEPLSNDFSLDIGERRLSLLDPKTDERNWRVTCVDTGQTAQTGTRVLRAAARIAAPRVVVAYGDSLGNIDVTALLRFHAGHDRAATVTAVRGPQRWGVMAMGEGDSVTAFDEKPRGEHPIVNGGFMVLERRAFDAFDPAEDVSLERTVLPRLAAEGQLAAFIHHDFWAAMDTSAERDDLERLWNTGRAPWLELPR